jgi:hypothetical protein
MSVRRIFARQLPLRPRRREEDAGLNLTITAAHPWKARLCRQRALHQQAQRLDGPRRIVQNAAEGFVCSRGEMEQALVEQQVD